MSDAPIFELIGSGDLEALEKLLAEHPEQARMKSERDMSPLMLALYHRQPSMAMRIAQAAGELDLFEATALGRAERVAEVLDADPGQVESVAPDGFRALHIAAFFGHTELVEKLLKRGARADVVAANGSDLRPLHSAAACGDVASARLLLEHGAPADAQQAGGWTALHSAAKHGNLELAKLLLEHGSDPEKPAADGTTAIAFAEANTEMLELLGKG